jgi:capsular polysaccharide transport system permease protein
MTLARGAFIQLQVVHALVLRETRTRFGAHQLGYLWAVLEPLMWIGTFWGLYMVTHRQTPHGLDTVAFLGTGILTYELFNKNVGRVGEAINGNTALLFYPQVQPIDLVWARAALETATIGSVFVLVMAGNLLLRPDEAARVDDLLRTMQGLGCAALLGSALGLTLCMLGQLSNVVERLRGPIMRPMFWISGLFYTFDQAPPQAQPILSYNPVLHCVEMVREGWFDGYDSSQASASYVLGCALALLALGLLLERVVRRRLELT